MSEFTERDWDIVNHLAEQTRKEREQHLAQIEFVDIAERVQLVGEINVPALVEADLRQQVSAQEVVTVKADEPIRHIRFSDLTVNEIPQKEIVADGIIESLSLTQDGKFAAKTKDTADVTVGDLKDRTVDRKVTLGEETSYGFLSDGRFVHLDETGVVNIDGQSAGLNRIKPRRFRKDIVMPVRRIEVNDNLVLIEELEINEAHARETREPVYWIGDPPHDYYTNWYYLNHRVVEATPEGTKGVFSASTGLTKEELTGPWYSRKTLKTDIHNGGVVSFVEQHHFNMADAFYGLPLYDKVRFFASDTELGSSRADSSLIGNRAITVSDDGEIGFIGKSDGTIEVVNLQGKPDAGKLHAEYDQAAWVDNEPVENAGFGKAKTRSVAHFTSELRGDPYPHRRAPKSITFWKAHDNPVAKLYSSGNEVYSVDSTGNIRRWQLGQEQAA